MNYSEKEKEIFKLNKFRHKDLFLMEESIKDKERILNELERFKNTFKDKKEVIDILEQFIYSHVLSRNSLLCKGDILKEIKDGIKSYSLNE